jgi:hypothetical protein
MTSYNFFIIIIIAVFMVAILVVLLQPTPLKEPVLSEHEQAIKWLEIDIQIHKALLEQPEEIVYAAPYIVTGNYAYHQRWIDIFPEIINYINHVPSKYTKQECVELLKEAQSTHAGIVSCDYAVLKWHYDWFQNYDKIIKHVENSY